MKKKEGCTKCGSHHSSPLITGTKRAIYWFATLAGTKDFGILLSNFKKKFVGSTSKIKPKNTKIYDFYCSECFKKIMKAQISFIKKTNRTHA